MQCARRRPSPFEPFYCPAWWREPGRAWLDGKQIDLVRVFASARSYTTINRIQIRDDDGVMHWWFRESGEHERGPYPKRGPSTLARTDAPITDHELEKRCAEVLGVRVKLAGGRDTPRKKRLRHDAVTCLTTALLERDTAPMTTPKKKLPPRRANVRGRDRRLKGNRR